MKNILLSVGSFFSNLTLYPMFLNEDVSDINEMFQDIIDEFGLEEVESEGLPYQEEPPQGLYYNWSIGKSNSRKTLALNVFCMGVVFRHKYLLMYPQLLEFVKRLQILDSIYF